MSEQWAVHNTVIKNINDLIEYDSNPREHTPEQVEQVANSIREFGWTMPILIDETNEIIAGHGRLMAGKQLGIKEVPCIVAQGWSDEQKKAYCIADNKLTENSTWSKDFLKLNLTNLYDNEFDLKLTGFSDDELSKLLPDFNIDEGLTDEDDVPTPPEEPVTKLGDIWLCGEHRVMCGDSGDTEMLEKLMNKQKADMIFTDPPYGVDYDGIKNDDRKGLEELLEKSFYHYQLFSKSGSSIYCFHSDRCADIFHKVFRNYFHFSSMIIWEKNSLTLSQTDYQSIHEPCLYGWNKNGTHTWYGDRKETSVWKVYKENLKGHTTPKPIAFIDKALKNSSKSEDIVIDFFAGSGSTLIACQKNNRISIVMELDPKYCDVIVKRWQNYTGQEATLESDGAKFNDMLK